MTNLLDSNLFVGTMNDLKIINENEWAVVHATQTYHYKLFNWDKKHNKPDKNGPYYIKYHKENHFSLNWVDGPAYLYKWSGVDTFNEILDFIDKWIIQKKILVHCDQGFSRSPTVCLLYLSKRRKVISNDSFHTAVNDFVKIYPNYNPSGIADYVDENWNKFK